MEDRGKITEKTFNMVDEETRKLYSQKVIDDGVNLGNCGIINNPDGYAKITGT
ncbi:MAG: hypothetical protein Q7J27_11955 [Syntrophales bacterium]|nr:hypothetical protein [Syntrophales bacterium]